MANREQERKWELATEFQRALIGEPGDAPWGLTPDRVLELRPTQEDIELWLLATRYPGISLRRQLSRGRKAYFTRRLRKVWDACAASYAQLDRYGRPGYYEVWTTGNAYFNDPNSLGIIWGQSMDRATQLAELLFRHVAGPNKYAPTGRGTIRVRFLGGSLGEGEGEARARQDRSVEEMEQAWSSAAKAAGTAADRVELLAARLDAIRSVDLVPGRSG